MKSSNLTRLKCEKNNLEILVCFFLSFFLFLLTFNEFVDLARMAVEVTGKENHRSLFAVAKSPNLGYVPPDMEGTTARGSNIRPLG